MPSLMTTFHCFDNSTKKTHPHQGTKVLSYESDRLSTLLIFFLFLKQPRAGNFICILYHSQSNQALKALARIRKPSHRGVQPEVGCRDLCVEPMRHQSVEPMRHQRTPTPNISTPWQRG